MIELSHRLDQGCCYFLVSFSLLLPRAPDTSPGMEHELYTSYRYPAAEPAASPGFDFGVTDGDKLLQLEAFLLDGIDAEPAEVCSDWSSPSSSSSTSSSP